MIQRRFLFTDMLGNSVYTEDMVMFNGWCPGTTDSFDHYPEEPIYCKIDDPVELLGANVDVFEDDITGYTILMPWGEMTVGLRRELLKINVDRLTPACVHWTHKFRKDIGID